MTHVFISYSKKNRVYARALADHLLSFGFDVWIDDRIDYGDDWWRTIVRAVRNAKAFVVIMTDESDSSEWVQREVTLANKYRIPPFPLWLSGDFHESENWAIYVRTQFADVTDGSLPLDDFFNRLARVLPPKSTPGSNVTPQEPEPLAPITDKILAEEIANPPAPDTATFPAVPRPAAIVTSEVETPTLVVTTPQQPSLLRRVTTIPLFRSPNSRLVSAAIVVLLLVGFVFLRGLQPISAGQIAFTSNPNGQYDIYVMDTNGTNLRQLTNDSVVELSLDWSPDGKQIMFRNDIDIFIMDTNSTSPRQITNSSTTEFSPDWSPDGKQIAFMSRTKLRAEIYVMNTDGTNTHNITNNDQDNYEPDWSPDGKKIAYYSGALGIYEIYVMNADGTDQQRLANGQSKINKAPAWSPDGKQIAFYSSKSGASNTDIYLMNADGSNIRQLTNNAASNQSPTWSPDGKQIAFTSVLSGKNAVYIMNVDGSDVHLLTDNTLRDLGVAWRPMVSSPDILVSLPTVDINAQATQRFIVTQTQAPIATQRAIAKATSAAAAQQQISFTSDQNGRDEIYVTDGKTTRQLTNISSFAYGANWSPDGNHIAYSSSSNGNIKIFVMDADGTDPQQLTTTFSDDSYPVWSPDGNYIAFLSREHKGANYEIWVMDADGGNAHNVTKNAKDDFSPTWSPDSKQIAFRSDRDGDGEIFLMKADGSDQRPLTDNSIADYLPSWSPDGSLIAFTSYRDGNDEIYVMDPTGKNVRRLTNNPSVDTYGSWSPDSKQIVFRSDRDGENEIYVMDLTGNNIRQITHNTSDDYDPQWRPAVPNPDNLLKIPTVNPTSQAGTAAQVTKTAAVITATASAIVKIRILGTSNVNIRPQPSDITTPSKSLPPKTEDIADMISKDGAWVHLKAAGGWVRNTFVETIQGSLADLPIRNQ